MNNHLNLLSVAQSTMSLIEKIQKLPPERKIKIIWVVAIVVAALMIVLWILAAKFQKNVPADTTLFQTIGRGVNDLKNNWKK